MNRGEFTRAILEKLHVPIKPSLLYFGVAWAVAEGCEAKNNPWATTEGYPDATDFNTDGVKNYKTWDDGINATMSTLVLDYYKQLVAALKDEKSSIGEIIAALNASPWGSHITLELYTEVMKKYDFYNTEIVGSPKEVKETPTLWGMAPTVASVVPTRADVLGEDNDEENEVTQEDDVNEAAAKADAAAPVVSPVPAPVAEDTLEDRLKRLTETGSADVKNDVTKLEADYKVDEALVVSQFDGLTRPTVPGYTYDTATDTYVKDTTTTAAVPAPLAEDTLEDRLRRQGSLLGTPTSSERRVSTTERRTTPVRRTHTGRRSDSVRRVTELAVAPTEVLANTNTSTMNTTYDEHVPERRVTTNTNLPTSLERRTVQNPTLVTTRLIKRITEGL
jgi:hypothetical protein